MPTNSPLPEERRAQLDGIVKQMIRNKESDANIRFVVDDFKKKYTPVTPPPAPVPQKSFLDKAVGVTDAIFGGGKIGEAIGTQVVKAGTRAGMFDGPGVDYSKVTPEVHARLEAKGIPTSAQEARNEVADSIQGPTAGQVAGSALQSAALFTPVGKIAGGLTAGARALGVAKGASAIGKIGAGAVAGGAFDVANNLQEGKTGSDVLTPGASTALGAAIPAVGVGINAASRVAKTVAPKLLSYTSDVPEQAFKTMLERRASTVDALKRGATPQTALENTQDAVRGLRTSLSSEWDEGMEHIIKEFDGKRWGMNDRTAKLATKVAEDFGIELPQNVKNISAKESIDLLKEVNELYSKRMVRESAQGIPVRKLKEMLQENVIGAFGGKEGSVSNFYKNYSSKKGVLDAANDIVRAYSTGKPIQQSTALNRLQTLFNDNKPAYLEAIMDLEKATGRDLLSEIAASKFSSKLPATGSTASATSGMVSQLGPLDKAIRLLLLPLSSPRSAGFIARALGHEARTGVIKGPGDALLETKVGKKVGAAVKESLENAPGLSIKDVSRDPQGKYTFKDTMDIKKLISHEGAPDRAQVEAYKKKLRMGEEVEPLLLMKEGNRFGIEDGKHRFQALLEMGYGRVPVKVIKK